MRFSKLVGMLEDFGEHISSIDDIPENRFFGKISAVDMGYNYSQSAKTHVAGVNDRFNAVTMRAGMGTPIRFIVTFDSGARLVFTGSCHDDMRVRVSAPYDMDHKYTNAWQRKKRDDTFNVDNFSAIFHDPEKFFEWANTSKEFVSIMKEVWPRFFD